MNAILIILLLNIFIDPPTEKAEIFAKGTISTDLIEHSAPAYSPEMDIVVWGVVEGPGKPARILEMKQQNGAWTTATPVSFSSPDKDDFYPRFSPDGKTLYFSSRRSLPQGFPQADMWIWSVQRTKNGWGEPAPLSQSICEGYEYSHSISKKGTMVYSFRKENGKVFDIAMIVNGKRQVLPAPINTDKTEDGPYISPDEDFLIFESSRPGGKGSNDLYICFKQKDGSFGTPINMGDKINTEHSERFAGLSPDGKILYFGSDRNGPDLYWISAGVIDELKK
jgi:Tol biopolymer transport system component